MGGVGLCLIDPLDFVFDGIFDGMNVDALVVDTVDECIERRCLPGPGRAGDEDEALVSCHDSLQSRSGERRSSVGTVLSCRPVCRGNA